MKLSFLVFFNLFLLALSASNRQRHRSQDQQPDIMDPKPAIEPREAVETARKTSVNYQEAGGAILAYTRNKITNYPYSATEADNIGNFFGAVVAQINKEFAHDMVEPYSITLIPLFVPGKTVDQLRAAISALHKSLQDTAGYYLKAPVAAPKEILVCTAMIGHAKGLPLGTPIPFYPGVVAGKLELFLDIPQGAKTPGTYKVAML